MWSGVRFRIAPRAAAASASPRAGSSTAPARTGRRRRACSSSSSAGGPRLPPTRTWRPARAAMRPTSVVTVLLPLVPVMPSVGMPRVARANSSMSPTTSRPRSRAPREDRLGQRHAWRGDHQRRAVQQRGVEAAAAQRRPRCELAQARHARRLGAAVGDRDLPAAPHEMARGRHAAAAEPDDHGGARWRGVAVGGGAHRSFRVERPASTRKKVMIQKRTITFGSAQPLSSK